MSFLKRLFGGQPQKPDNAIAYIKGSGAYDIDIVGESHYQDNLEKICGERSKEGEEKQVRAMLILENNNPKDKNAIRVEINGLPVGYFDKMAAAEFRKALKKTSIGNTPIQCEALIVGGWKRKNSIGSYGVKLDLPNGKE